MSAVNHSAIALSDEALWQMLREDSPHGDLTTHSLGIDAEPGRISFAARRAMCVAGVEEAARMFSLCGAQVNTCAPSGAKLAAGDRILEAHGPAAALFKAWKTAQTLVEWSSGIATRAAAMVASTRAAGSHAAVACTRKNVPGTRTLATKAVFAGGMIAHRLGLSETVMVTPEHQRFITTDTLTWLQQLAHQCPEKRVVVEVLTHEQGIAFAEAGADVIQLEKFSPVAVAEFVSAVRALAPLVRVAAAGGIDEHNIALYAATGADVLVTSAPYSAPPADVAVVFAT